MNICCELLRMFQSGSKESELKLSKFLSRSRLINDATHYFIVVVELANQKLE